MKFGSVCSGIEAASVAWEPLGWEAQWFSEIEHFPSAVLNHRFPTVPNLGDMTKIHETQEFNDSTIDLLVGGTPCQSFSVAGLRKGLADPRGNLMLTFLGLAERKKPRWLVWENVPGVLSSNGGRDFATFLTALGDIGYGFAYRVLDAQYFGVAQRRRRVFVVGYLGDWRPAGAVLFESESLSGNTKKSREKRKATSPDAQGGSGGGGKSTGVNPEIMATLCAKDNEKWGCNQWVNEGKAIIEPKASWWNGEQTAATLTKQNANGAQRMPDKDNFGAVLEPKAHAFKVRGGSEDNTGEQGGTPGKKAGKGYLGQDEKVFTIGTTQDQQIAQPIAYENRPSDARVKPMGETCQTLTSRLGTGGGNIPLVQQPIPFDIQCGSKRKDRPEGGFYIQERPDNARTLDTTGGLDPSCNQGGLAIAQPIAVDCYNQTINEKTTQTIGSSASDVNHYGAVLQPTMAIRRLTPKECERLQGFPDDWTLIPYRNKSADLCPDGPRYKACGNSMAVPVMRWIGERIQMVEQLMKEMK
jgi:DNA (cytosine-5)-methyltransferase 1